MKKKQNSPLMTKSPTDSPRAEMLREVEKLICNERNESYGHPVVNMTKTADMFRAYLGDRTGNSITATDIAVFGIILKLGRLAHDPKHLDSLKDIAGYSAISYECVLNGKVDLGS